MGSNTPNFDLFKPDPSDLVNVTVDLSDNYDKIDAHAHSGTYVPLVDARGIPQRYPNWPIAPSVKLWGGNITVKAAHAGSFKAFFLEWDWAGWIQVQVDRAISVGATAIRLIGDVAGVNDGTFSQSTYEAHWEQLAQYCLDNGLYLYPCLGGSTQFTGLSLAQIQAVMVSLVQALDAYPNVIAYDIVNEVDAWQANQGISYPTQLANMATLSAAVRAVSDTKITYSMVIGNSGTWTTDAGTIAVDYDAMVDFFDAHIYYSGLLPHDPDPFLAAVDENKPLMVGEFGATQAQGAAVRTARYDAMRTFVGRYEFLGAFQWSINDGSASAATQFGMWSDAGVEQTDVTTSYRLGNKVNTGPSLRTRVATIDAADAASEPAAIVSFDGTETMRIRRRTGSTDAVIELPALKDLYIVANNTSHGLTMASPSRLTMADTVDMVLGTSTGTKIGTATSQKLGFFNATPVVQPVSGNALRTALQNLGILPSGGANLLGVNDADIGTVSPAKLGELRPTGSIAQTHPRIAAVTDLGALSTGRLTLIAIMLPLGVTITTITFLSRTTALVAGTNQWFALFDNAASPNLLRQTADDTNTAWAANAYKTLTLTSTFTTTYSGLHYLGIMVAAGTVPTLTGVNTASGTFSATAPVAAGTSTTGLTTPGSFTSPADPPAGTTTVAYAYVS